MRGKSGGPVAMAYLYRVSHNIRKLLSVTAFQWYCRPQGSCPCCPLYLKKKTKMVPLYPWAAETAQQFIVSRLCNTPQTWFTNSPSHVEGPTEDKQYVPQSQNLRGSYVTESHPIGTSIYVRDCHYQPLFEKTRILESHHDRTARVITKDVCISRRRPDSCVSGAPLVIQSHEILILNKWQRTEIDRVRHKTANLLVGRLFVCFSSCCRRKIQPRVCLVCETSQFLCPVQLSAVVSLSHLTSPKGELVRVASCSKGKVSTW